MLTPVPRPLGKLLNNPPPLVAHMDTGMIQIQKSDRMILTTYSEIRKAEYTSSATKDAQHQGPPWMDV